MDRETERAIDELRHEMEAIVFLRDGTVEKVETPYGKELPESDWGPAVQGVVDTYRNWPYKIKARLFVYPNGGFGVSLEG